MVDKIAVVPGDENSQFMRLSHSSSRGAPRQRDCRHRVGPDWRIRGADRVTSPPKTARWPALPVRRQMNRAGFAGGGRGDRQNPADRLDPVGLTMIVDEGDHRFSGRSRSA